MIYKTNLFEFISYAALVLIIASFTQSCHNKISGKNSMTKIYKNKSVEVNNIRINYSDVGEGEALVLVHGFASSTYTWRYIEEHFIGKYRVISIDLKGFGFSSKPHDQKYSIHDQSEILIEFMEKLGLSCVTVMGHSYGGAVALATFRSSRNKGQDLIKRLILIDSASYRHDFPDFISVLRTPLLNRISLSIVPSKINANFVLREAFYDDKKITKEMIDLYSYYLNLPGAHSALIQTANQIVPDDVEDFTKFYSKIDIPVLIIWGKKDQIVPISNGIRLQREIPNASFKVIENCGHMPQEECPEIVVHHISEFLSITKRGK